MSYPKNFRYTRETSGSTSTGGIGVVGITDSPRTASATSSTGVPKVGDPVTANAVFGLGGWASKAVSEPLLPGERHRPRPINEALKNAPDKINEASATRPDHQVELGEPRRVRRPAGRRRLRGVYLGRDEVGAKCWVVRSEWQVLSD